MAMALIKWEPKSKQVDPFRSLRQEVDRIFDDFFRSWSRPWGAGLPALAEGGFVPSVDLKETDKEFVLTAEVPGVSKDELDVTITEDSVTIRGERKAEKEEKNENYHYRETAYGSFQRVVPLPAEVVPDKAKAKLKDGVLTLTLPKAEPAKPKGVKVKVE
ncbi:MAG: Hsp20/alpha crystallin family protein [Candidatus Dadabacteria bacterium]|nr:MAG: Hsp20/alpha crystallin family protein [Candidatus Dadabacteria bacterium]